MDNLFKKALEDLNFSTYNDTQKEKIFLSLKNSFTNLLIINILRELKKDTKKRLSFKKILAKKNEKDLSNFLSGEIRNFPSIYIKTINILKASLK